MLSRTVRRKTEPRVRTVKTCRTLVNATTRKHIVWPAARDGPSPPGSHANVPSQKARSPTTANATVCWPMAREMPAKKLSVRPMGLRAMMRSSERSRARLSPGMPSPSTLMSSSITGVSGVPQPASCAPSMITISERLHASRKYTVRLMLEKTLRPSRTAATMVAKSSSVSTMSAAALATSVPARPIATPTSAALSAGASFTPSPVMATTSPCSCQASTMRILSSGETRAYTEKPRTLSTSSSSDMAASSRPVTTRPPSPRSPIWRAMAPAVAAWSPVIITVRMPARRASAMARAASGR